MNKIKQVLEKRGVSQTWLCRKLGKSYNMVTSYVNNKRQPSVEMLFQIAEVLDVEPSALLVKRSEISKSKNWKGLIFQSQSMKTGLRFQLSFTQNLHIFGNERIKVGDTINFDFVTYSVRKVSTSVKLGDTIILTVNKLDKAI